MKEENAKLIKSLNTIDSRLKKQISETEQEWMIKVKNEQEVNHALVLEVETLRSENDGFVEIRNQLEKMDTEK